MKTYGEVSVAARILFICLFLSWLFNDSVSIETVWHWSSHS
jgi:hypothetical protein